MCGPSWNPKYSVLLYTVDMSVLLENIPLVKFIWNYIRDSTGIFSVFSPVKILMISLISSLSLKLFLNLLVYDWNISGSSLKVFGNLRKRLSGLWKNCGKSSEIFEKWLEIFGKSSSHYQYVYIIKTTLHITV